MRVFAFSDLHRDLAQAAVLAEISGDADLVIGAGDFASVHEGLDEAVAALAGIQTRTLLVPGNNETAEALRAAVAGAGWDAATVLHGETAELDDGLVAFGLGAGIPTTPWDWSFDLSEEEARDQLSALPEGALLIVHSPPSGHCDQAGNGRHFGSEAILEAISERPPVLAVCGHIHESWGQRSAIGQTEVANLGPTGAWFDVEAKR